MPKIVIEKQKKMNTLFEQLDNWKLGSDAQQLDDKTHGLLDQIYREYISKGYNPREIGYVIQMANYDLTLMYALERKPC